MTNQHNHTFPIIAQIETEQKEAREQAVQMPRDISKTNDVRDSCASLSSI